MRRLARKITPRSAVIAIADMTLARSVPSLQRFYSLSAQIRLERKSYYDLLEHTQRGDLDLTPWLEWFLECLGRAIDTAEATLGEVLRKARFWEAQGTDPFNERQRVLLKRLLDGFEGKLTSSKWAKLSQCSQDTTLRGILELVERKILTLDAGGGRSSSYRLHVE